MTIRYEAELQELRRAGVIDDATAARAMALDRGTVFSVFEELRVALYVAVALITTGIGILIKENLDRIGPVAVVVTLAVIAALCYLNAIRLCLRGASRSLGGDYILLLGALILSTDVAYGESQFHWLGGSWSWHLLILAGVHAVTAYALNSRLVLSVALTSLAGWFGVAHNTLDAPGIFGELRQLGGRALLCAAVITVVRWLHTRSVARRDFTEVFDHFATNLAFWGALAWCGDPLLRWVGVPLLTALAAVSILKGLRRRQEIFVVYGILYAAMGYSKVVHQLIQAALGSSIIVLLIVLGAATLLWKLHGRLKESAL